MGNRQAALVEPLLRALDRRALWRAMCLPTYQPATGALSNQATNSSPTINIGWVSRLPVAGDARRPIYPCILGMSIETKGKAALRKLVAP